MITSTHNQPGIPGAKAPAPINRPDKAEKELKRETEAISEAIAEKRKQAEEDPKVDREAAAETVARALDMDFPKNASLEIAVNDQDDGFVYRAIDRDTGEVIKQFPAEEVLSRLERLNRMQGLAVDGAI